MPRRHDDGIGSHGLEQGGANLGNDYSRPIATDRNEQNTTTNIGNLPQDRDSDDNGNIQNPDVDSSVGTGDGDEGGSTPDPETLSTRDDDQAH
jgi:hypothetical protein